MCQSVSFRSSVPTNCKNVSANKNTANLKTQLENEGVSIPKLTPLQSGLVGGCSMALLGFSIDRLMGAIKFFKTPLKFSLVLNGVLGVAAGISAYINAKKAEHT